MSQQTQPDHSGQAITFVKIEPYTEGVLLVASDAVDVDGWLDPVHAQSGDETSPALSWEASPGVVSYLLVVEDPDAPQEAPVVHWLMWNIPGSLHGLPAGLDRVSEPEGSGGAIQGLNSHGKPGWLGMAPPEGHGPHRYHFQLFGLDRRLDLAPDTSLADIVNVLKGATVAKGELVGLFEVRGPMDEPSPARTGSYGSEPAT
jgi:Raf kinase inhibitor-like YbhB/YbcL family protein